MRTFPAFCAGMIAALTLSTAAQEPGRLRVLSFNIHHAEGTDGKLDLERIARIIRGVAPDLVALQEIDYTNDRTGRVDQAAELAKLTGLTAVRGDNIDYAGGRYGNAALVRGTVTSSKNHLLPKLAAPEQRGVLLVEVAAAEGRPTLTFLVTHLAHRREDEPERLAAARFINELIAESDRPAILAGDLNATPESEPLALLGRVWGNATVAEALLTIPSDAPRRQIDFVLARPKGGWRTVEARTLDEPIASDHRPLFVVLEAAP